VEEKVKQNQIHIEGTISNLEIKNDIFISDLNNFVNWQ